MSWRGTTGILAASAALGLVVGGGLAVAQDTRDTSPGTGDQISLSATDTRISADEAKQRAVRAAGGGVVGKIELELEDEGLQWHVDVIKNGGEFDVRIDATSGEVVRLRTDNGGQELVNRDDGAREDDGARGDEAEDRDDDRNRGGDSGGNSGPGSGGSDDGRSDNGGDSGPGGSDE